MIKVAEKPKVVVRKRTAAPLAKSAAGGRVPPRPPIEVIVGADPERHVPVTLSLPPGLIRRLDDWAHEKRLTRSKAARSLLEDGLK